MRLKAVLLAILLVVPVASRVQAGSDPTPGPKKKMKVQIVSPEGETVWADGDGQVIIDGDASDLLADLGELPNLENFTWFEGSGYIGIRPLAMTPELRAHFGAPKDAGVFVGRIEDASPAAKAGLQVGDIVTAADGDRVGDARDLVRVVRRKKEGDTVKIEIVRDRATKTLTVTVAERDDMKIHVGDAGPGKRKFQLRRAFPAPPVPPMPPAAPMAPVPPSPPSSMSPNLQERLDDLEKRLDALEGRTPQP